MNKNKTQWWLWPSFYRDCKPHELKWMRRNVRRNIKHSRAMAGNPLILLVRMEKLIRSNNRRLIVLNLIDQELCRRYVEGDA